MVAVDVTPRPRLVGAGAASAALLAQRLPAPLALDPHDAAQAWIRVVSRRDGQAFLLDPVEQVGAGLRGLLGIGVEGWRPARLQDLDRRVASIAKDDDLLIARRDQHGLMARGVT